MTEPTDRDTALPCAAAGGREFVLFSSLWAAATLFHLASYDEWRDWAPMAIAAALVLIRPGSVMVFAVLVLAQLHYTARMLPYTPNHWLFTSLVSGAILWSMAHLVVRHRRFRVGRAEILMVCAPAIRVALIALYFFAVFHKLNSDFFDPAVSCGGAFYAAQLSVLPLLPQSASFQIGALYAAIGFETAIPLLLCFDRTRNAGILAGMLFHYLLALNPLDAFYNFSAMLFALYALFAPSSIVAHPAIGGRAFRRATAGLAGVFALLALLAVTFPRPQPRGFDPFLVVWCVYGGTLIALFAHQVWREGAPSNNRVALFAIRTPALVALPVVVILNGTTPYLGLKTDVAWAMFSNLRTEGGRSNHWVIPAGIQMFDFEQDLVQVTASSNPYLQRLAVNDQLVPYFELRRRPEASVSYVRNGVEAHFSRVSDDPAFSTIPRVMRKLLLFRPVDRTDKQTCLH